MHLLVPVLHHGGSSQQGRQEDPLPDLRIDLCRRFPWSAVGWQQDCHSTVDLNMRFHHSIDAQFKSSVDGGNVSDYYEVSIVYFRFILFSNNSKQKYLVYENSI